MDAVVTLARRADERSVRRPAYLPHAIASRLIQRKAPTVFPPYLLAFPKRAFTQMVDRKTFLSLLSRQLYPVLRAEGFKGSGTTLRRLDGPVIHVFNVQGSSSGNQCYLNLGAHLSFLPGEGGSVVQAAKIEEPHCIFRERLVPPPGKQFGWAYGSTIEQAEENIEFIVSEWPSLGRPFFDRYKNFPESFVALVSGTSPSTIHPRDCLHFARICKELDLADLAVAFARSGRERVGERAIGLRADLDKILLP